MIEIYRLPSLLKGIFLERTNRFVAKIKLLDQNIELTENVHVHDPGRLKELLYPGNKVLIVKAKNKNRKTGWDLIAAKKDDEWIFVHSAYHRRFTEIILEKSLISNLKDLKNLRAEVPIKDGRLDFSANIGGKKIWIETKGCTLIKGDIAYFPDAPTSRGSKHLTSLISLKNKGDRSAVIILIFSKKAECFSPNKETDPLFSKTFYKAIEKGVEIYPVSLTCDGRFVYFNKEIHIVKEMP